MAAANAGPTAGPGAEVVTCVLGVLLDVVADAGGAVVDVTTGLVAVAVGTGAATP
jgi:hypothetical protein